MQKVRKVRELRDQQDVENIWTETLHSDRAILKFEAIARNVVITST